MAREERLKQVMRDLGRALAAAIAAQPEVGESLRRARDDGYNLYVVLDGKRQGFGLELARCEAPNPSGPATFRINGEDLVFLRSIGIDPTRRRRRRAG